MTFRQIVAIVLIIFGSNIIHAQKQKEQIITSVQFEPEKIILNEKHAFNYIKQGNNFQISNLKNVMLISGKITPVEKGKFTSLIYFATVDKQFQNPKIIGRNDLIFALCENNVITSDFEIDGEKLQEFINKYNQLAVTRLPDEK
jgi:hypothetical protein